MSATRKWRQKGAVQGTGAQTALSVQSMQTCLVTIMESALMESGVMEPAAVRRAMQELRVKTVYRTDMVPLVTQSVHVYMACVTLV